MKAMQKKWGRLVLMACAGMISCAALALGPEETMSGVVNDILGDLKTLKTQNQLNITNVDKLVDQKMMPIISTQQVSMRVLGRQAWAEATPAQKDEFIHCFRNVIVKTYAAALVSYDHDVVNFLPGTSINGDLATVRSTISRPDGRKFTMNYLLVNELGNWKVADFSVEGIGLDSSYNSQFTSILSQGGLPALLTRICAR